MPKRTDLGGDPDGVGDLKWAPGPGGRAPLPRWLGVVWLAGAVASADLLLIQGGFMLLAGLAARALANLGPPDAVRVDGMGALMAAGAGMVVAGAMLTVGFSVLTVRAFAGRPYPGWRRIAGHLGLTAVLVAATALGARRLTEPATGPVPASLAGLEGVWSGEGDWAYRFNADGTLDGWWSGLPGGRVGTWSRSGPTVVVRTDRDWQLVGTLRGDTLRGTFSQASTGAYPTPASWTRRSRP